MICALAATAGVATAAVISGTTNGRLNGSGDPDVLKGRPGADRLYGFGGNDQLFGYEGDDILVGGNGRDLMVGGPGDDRIDARDGARDIVYCGPGTDRVARDRRDKLASDCEGKLDPGSLPPAPKPKPVSAKNPGHGGGGGGGDRGAARLIVRVSGGGSVQSSPAGIDCPGECRARFSEGTRVTLSARAGRGRSFQAWGAMCEGSVTTCTVRLERSTWVRAIFSGSDGGSGGGTTPPPPGPPPPTPPPGPPPPPPSGASIVRENQSWTCTGPVNLDLVRVTMRHGSSGDAIYLREGCTGRIGRIEVQTWVGDGLKVNGPDPEAHDLVIDGGYIRCYDGVAHQDGIQAMGGQRITFRNLEINCNSLPNAQLFIAGSNGGNPADIVCENCVMGSGGAHTLFVTNSTRSGARNSIICEARYHDIRIENASSPVNTGNTVIPSSDPRCHA